MGKRKRWLAALLALTLFLPTAALADDVGEYSTLRAYWALVGNQTADQQSPADQLLTGVMNGEYGADKDSAHLSGALTSLAAITTADLAGFAGRNQMPVEMVRHAYYKALANALAAEIEG